MSLKLNVAVHINDSKLCQSQPNTGVTQVTGFTKRGFLIAQYMSSEYGVSWS